MYGMRKARDYELLADADLPIPRFCVFDSNAMCEGAERARLELCVAAILRDGSGLVGIRTEPKQPISRMGNYPHYMPLSTLETVLEALAQMKRAIPARNGGTC